MTWAQGGGLRFLLDNFSGDMHAQMRLLQAHLPPPQCAPGIDFSHLTMARGLRQALLARVQQASQPKGASDQQIAAMPEVGGVSAVWAHGHCGTRYDSAQAWLTSPVIIQLPPAR